MRTGQQYKKKQISCMSIRRASAGQVGKGAARTLDMCSTEMFVVVLLSEKLFQEVMYIYIFFDVYKNQS